MPYTLLPYIILIISVAGLLLLIGRKLPEANALEASEERVNLLGKGWLQSHIVLDFPSKIYSWVKFYVHKLWHFILEAKDIKKTGLVGYRIKKILPRNRAVKTKATSTPVEARDEQYYLEQIRQHPKDNELYNLLGKLYLDTRRFADSRDMYSYLVKRDPGNALYYGRLGYACYKLGLYSEAVDAYEKSLAVDSTQPNRHYNLALSLEALRRTDEAVLVIKRAIEQEPASTKYQELLATLEQKQSLN